jgi:hypothetical protein
LGYGSTGSSSSELGLIIAFSFDSSCFAVATCMMAVLSEKNAIVRVAAWDVAEERCCLHLQQTRLHELRVELLFNFVDDGNACPSLHVGCIIMLVHSINSYNNF